MNEDLISAQEAAERLGVGYATVLRRAKVGEIPHLKIGRRIRFRVQDIELLCNVFSTKELVRRLGIPYSTLLKKVKNGEIVAVRHGPRYEFRREDIEAYLGAPLPADPGKAATKPKKQPRRATIGAASQVLDEARWFAHWERLGKPEALSLDLFLTLSAAAFDAQGALTPQFRTEGVVSASIVRHGPHNYLVALGRDGGWRDVAEEGSATDACWAASDALWDEVCGRGASEAYVAKLRHASLGMYRLDVERLVRRWRAKHKAVL